MQNQSIKVVKDTIIQTKNEKNKQWMLQRFSGFSCRGRISGGSFNVKMIWMKEVERKGFLRAALWPLVFKKEEHWDEHVKSV